MPAIAPAFKEQDLDVVGQPVDQCDGPAHEALGKTVSQRLNGNRW